MAEWFKGMAIKAGIMRSDEQEKLDNMLVDYARGGPGHKATADAIATVMSRSPDLKERTLEVVRADYLNQYSDKPVDNGASASYHVSEQSLRVKPGTASDGNLMFMLGHETEHARSLRGDNYGISTLVPAIERLASQPGDGPRDYTGIVDAFVERTRREEGRAHLGGFNAIASHVATEVKPGPDNLLQALYETAPLRMGDFISKSNGGPPSEYALKPGLTMNQDGSLPYSDSNIEAMKGYYADKAQLGAPHMNYRQDSIEFASGLIRDVETALAERNFEDRTYVIDPTRLQAHPLLGLPPDGAHTAKGLPEMQSLDSLGLGIDLHVGPTIPVVSSSSSTPVSLTTTPQDHPLFAQALPLVVELSGKDKLGDPQELRNLAAALAVSAHEQGLTSIDKVVLSEKDGGVIASQGSGVTSRNALVDGITGIGRHESESLGRLPPSPSPSVSSVGTPSPVLESVVEHTEGVPKKTGP